MTLTANGSVWKFNRAQAGVRRVGRDHYDAGIQRRDGDAPSWECVCVIRRSIGGLRVFP